MKKTQKILGWFFLICLIAVLSFFSYQKYFGGKDSPFIPENISMNEYDNEEYGVSLKFPSDWQLWPNNIRYEGVPIVVIGKNDHSIVFFLMGTKPAWYYDDLDPSYYLPIPVSGKTLLRPAYPLSYEGWDSERPYALFCIKDPEKKNAKESDFCTSALKTKSEKYITLAYSVNGRYAEMNKFDQAILLEMDNIVQTLDF